MSAQTKQQASSDTCWGCKLIVARWPSGVLRIAMATLRNRPCLERQILFLERALAARQRRDLGGPGVSSRLRHGGLRGYRRRF